MTGAGRRSGPAGAARRLRRSTVALWLAASVLAVAAGHFVYWRWATERLESGFATWAAARRTEGWTVRADPPRRGGWPLATVLTIPRFAVAGGQPDIPGGLAWSVDRLTLTVALLHPHSLSIGADGQQRLRLGAWPEIPYTADRLRAEVPLEPGLPTHSAELDGAGLRAGLPTGPDAAGALTAGRLRFHLDRRPAAPQGEPALAVSGTVEDVRLPLDLTWTLGGRIASLALDGALDGPLPRRPGLARRAVAWRDGGGSLEIQRLALDWGPLALTGSATMALDAQLQPMGTGTARIVGYAETLDALAGAGAIRPGVATAAKAVAALIASPAEAGGPAAIEVPLTLQGRTLLIRQIPLARMPELIWPPE